MIPNGNNKNGLFLIKWRLTIKAFVQLQILVIRYSYWYAFMFRHSVIIQENVFNHANKLFWRWLWHQVWVNVRLSPSTTYCFDFRAPHRVAQWKTSLTWTCHEERLQMRGLGALFHIVNTKAIETNPQKNNLIQIQYFRDFPLPSLCCFGKCKTLGSDFAIANVLHSELCCSGQSQVLRVETFSCVYWKKMQPEDVFFQLFTLYLYTSFPEFGSSWNPWVNLLFAKSMDWWRQCQTCAF